MDAGLLAILITLGLVALMVIPTAIVKKKQGKSFFSDDVIREHEERKAQREARAQRRAGIREKQAQGVPCCPFCGCTSLSSQKRGYRVGKGVLWGVLLAAAGFWLGAFIGAGVGLALGLSFGSIGSGQVYCTCLSCGRRFRAGFRW